MCARHVLTCVVLNSKNMYSTHTCTYCVLHSLPFISQVGGISNAGSVISDAKVKLVDVPEMGYLTTDSPPRGEICVQTTAMVDGYYKNDVETAEKFVDGYFRTGDIGVMESPDKVRIIDRKKNLFKLAQGEFVSPERLD